MPKAKWNGAVLAESDDTVIVEGNHYFPRYSLNSAWHQMKNQADYLSYYHHLALPLIVRLGEVLCRRCRDGGLCT